MVHSTLAAAALFLIVDLVRERRGATGLRLVPVRPVKNAGLLAGMFFAGAIAMAGMPPLSGFLGKLMILDATRGDWLIWGTILVTSLIAIVGFGRAGSMVFWKAHAAEGIPPEGPRDATSPGLAFTAAGGLLAGLVALTVLAGPATDWLRATAAQIHAPQAYIDAVMQGAYERAWSATSGHEDGHATPAGEPDPAHAAEPEAGH
jgi:multicomponent K+:H+ antiporter subunit D